MTFIILQNCIKIINTWEYFLLETIYRLEANFSILLNVLKGDLEL